MFISKAEKESIKEILVQHNKYMQELKKRIQLLEETMTLMRRIDAPLAESKEPLPAVVKGDFGFLKTRRNRSPSPTPIGTLSKYAHPFVKNIQVGDTVHIPATAEFTAHRISNTVSGHLSQRFGEKACFVRTSKDQSETIVVRTK
jgi:hypothetical protein